MRHPLDPCVLVAGSPVRRVAAPSARALFLAAAVLAGGAGAWASEVTPPVALGSSGLSLSLRLYKQATPATAAWPSQSTAAVTTTDLGTGEYFFAGLPTATGTERYLFAVAIASDPERALATTLYGARPGTSILWRLEVELPSSPQVFKVGDTFGSISMRITRRLPAAACEPETAATFTLLSLATNTAVTGIEDVAATITNCTLDQTTGTYGATFTYDLAEGTPSAAGDYLAEWRICYEPGVCHTLPPDNRVQVRFRSRFGG